MIVLGIYIDLMQSLSDLWGGGGEPCLHTPNENLSVLLPIGS